MQGSLVAAVLQLAGRQHGAVTTSQLRRLGVSAKAQRAAVDDGWLVLTHGVGPMRTYSIGAWLLDLDEPAKVLGRLRQPLLTPQPDEQDGYVPNVVYSCGAVVHDETLLIPFGIGDASIGFATVPLRELLAAIQ